MHGKQLRSRAVCLNLRICLQLFRELDTGTILNVHRKTFLADFSYSNVAISKLCASYFNSYNFHATRFDILFQKVHNKRRIVIYGDCCTG